jgi:hypothetical protein
MFTSSGLIVRFLKVFEKGNYNSIKWVRYLTKASGSYQIRVSHRKHIHSPNISCVSVVLNWMRNIPRISLVILSCMYLRCISLIYGTVNTASRNMSEVSTTHQLPEC